MADLIIRGLHLPKSLGGEETHVDIRIFSGGTVIMASSRPPYYKMFDAIPLPEGHGRLVDAREVLEKADKAPWFDGDASALGLLLGSEVTTILPADAPAEGGGEDG